ncbi:MAG: focA [Thermomicrobiales bacterium]|jgi:formate/nitrite transporter|nr:focA [Microvirga sp.]MCD6031359.1 focA [Thermomicrobiales bacterium]
MTHDGKPTDLATTAEHPGVDALLPSEIAAKAENVGAKKVRLDPVRLLALAVLAGAFIALGAMFATTVLAGASTMPFGMSRLVAGLVFSLGLILVVVGGAELFTGNTLMVMALAARKITVREMLRAWGIVYAGNFAGAFGTAVLVVLSGQYLLAKGQVAEVALSLAVAKVALPFHQALFLGVLCNVLVCLAVWLSLGARGTADKVLAVLFPVSAFVAAGFEHSVANMYLVPLGILIKTWAPTTLWSQVTVSVSDLSTLTWPNFLWSLVPVTIGNVIGGGVLVGAVYWFVYLRGARTG